MQKLPILALLVLCLLSVYSISEQDIIFFTVSISSLSLLIILIIKKSLTTGLLFLMLLVSIFYLIGHIFNLFGADIEYDGFLHFYSGFTISYLFGNSIKKIWSKAFIKQRLALIFIVILFGITVSISWEIFELIVYKFLPEYVIGELTDTISDLIFDSLGILLATILVIFKNNEQKH